MLTGELPGVVLQPPSRRVEIDVRLDKIVLRALDQNPELRFLNATEFRNAVETVVRTAAHHELRQTKTAVPTTPRSCQCYVTTPERLATLSGQIFLWRSHGQLILDDQQLTITHGAQVHSIPLRTIRDLSIGRFPALVNPAGLDFISVTCELDGETRQLIVSPHQGLIGLPQHFNQLVAEWFDVILETAKRIPGHTPTTRLYYKLNTPRTSRSGLAVLLIPMLLPVILIATLVWSNAENASPGTAENGPSGLPYSIFGAFGLAVLVPVLLALCLRRKPGQNSESHPDEETPAGTAPDEVPALQFGLRSVWGIRCLALAHLGFLGFLGNLLGFERAAGMFGFFGFIGIATVFEFRTRYRKHPRYRMVSIAAALALIVAVACFVGISMQFNWQIPEATVFTSDPVIDQGHFSFRHDIECPPDWNVWLTLECLQLRMTRPEDEELLEPIVTKRYQAKLEGKGRMRIPLDYLPTTNENHNQMLASIGPPSGTKSYPSPQQDYCLLHYTTESLMQVWARLKVLPDGQTPDSQLDRNTSETVRFVTIEAPARPTLGPFEGAYRLGKVELVALRLTDPTDHQVWKANGEPGADEVVPDRDGFSSAAGKVIKEIVVQVRSETKLASQPQLRFSSESGIAAMGCSFYRPDVLRVHAMLIQTIACPPEAMDMSVDVGIADGDWKNSLTFERHPKQNHFSQSQSGGRDGSWEGVVRTTDPSGGSIPLAFSYSHRDDYETRLVYERADGTIVPLKGSGTDGGHGLTNSLTSLPVEEFETIKRFHVQSRRYEWIEFQHVSLQLGHRTNVEVHSAY